MKTVAICFVLLDQVRAQQRIEQVPSIGCGYAKQDSGGRDADVRTWVQS